MLWLLSYFLPCRGLEKALDQIEAERSAKSGAEAAALARAAGLEVSSSLVLSPYLCSATMRCGRGLKGFNQGCRA